jgi:MFS family permease
MIETLSPYQLRKARDLYNIFNVFNALSWQFLIGNIITLFALRIEATSTYVGIISALLYMSYFFLSLGKLMAKKFSIVGVFSIGWLFRSIGMFPLVLVPFIYSAGHQKTALLLTVLGVSIFHIFRGIGMIGNNPVLSYLASGPDRGAYMTQTQIINSAMGMFGGFIIAMILGRNPPLFLYSIIFAAGIGTGIVSGILIRKTPEPPTEKGEKAMRFFDIFREAVSKPSLRRFVVIFLLMALTSGVARTFIIVYAREVFHQSDGMVSLYAVFGSLGNLMIGLLIKFLVDRIGAKPIFIICVLTGLISMIPIVFFPRGAVDNFTTITLFLTIIFFIINFGFLGAENIAQTYFLGLIPVELMMDMGILYFFVFGVAGASGSFLGGLFLDTLGALGLTPFLSFKLLFIILIVISCLVLFLQRKLIPLGALPFIGALEVMFSFRDLKAISLLDRLNKTSDSEEEEAILEALHDTPSKLAIKGLLHRARSPRLAVRTESLHAMEALKTLGEDAERALMNDIINNPYTTAYISARILGSHGVFSAIPLLRELTSSRDYMLAGEAMIALAKLGDHAFRPHIEAIIARTRNPRLKIMGVESFGIYGSPNSLSMLLDILRSADPPPYLRDEVVLAMASILDIQNQFYPILVRFLEDESQVWTLAKDEAESAFEYYRSVHGGKKNTGKTAKLAHIREQAKNFLSAIFSFINDSNGALLSRWILEIPDELTQPISQMVLSETVLDDELMGHRRLKLLIAHWVSHELRFWTNRLK